MTKALLDIPEEVNQTLSIIKAQFGLQNKVEAISLAVQTYKEQFMEPQLRPEIVRKILRKDKKKGVVFRSIKELRKRYE